MDRRQCRVEPLLVARVGRVADADDQTVFGKQTAAAAAFDRDAGHLHIGRALILVQRRHPAPLGTRTVAVVAAYAGGRHAGHNAIVGRRDPRGRHGAGRTHGQQPQVPLQVVAEQITRHTLSRIRSEQIDLDPPLALRIAENMATRQHEGLVAPGVDDRSRAARVSVGVFDPQSYGRRKQGRIRVGSDAARRHPAGGGCQLRCRGR